MPCSASTAAGEAIAARPVRVETSISARRTKASPDRKALTPSPKRPPRRVAVRGLCPLAGRNPRSGRMRGSALVDRLIKPLVIKGAFERRQLQAELLGMGCGSTRIKGFAVVPRLDQSEMIGV